MWWGPRGSGKKVKGAKVENARGGLFRNSGKKNTAARKLGGLTESNVIDDKRQRSNAVQLGYLHPPRNKDHYIKAGSTK